MTYTDKKMIRNKNFQIYCCEYGHSLPQKQNQILACHFQDVIWE